MKRNTHTLGYSLVEVLVAVSILMVSIVGPITIAAKNIQSAQFTRQQNTASFLAQEGISIANTLRNDSALEFVSGGTTDSWEWAAPGGSYNHCFNPNGCNIDYIDETLSNHVTNCAGPDSCRLLFDASAGRVKYQLVSGDASPYTRVIRFTNVTSAEVRVESTVSWDSALFGGTQQITLETTLFDQFSTFAAAPAPAPTPSVAGASCNAILAAGDSTGDGIYEIDPTGSDPFDTFCDMSLDGGGWTLAINAPSAGGGAIPDVSALNTSVHGKLSDTRISTLLGASSYTENNVRVDINGSHDAPVHEFGMRVENSAVAGYSIPNVNCSLGWTAGPTVAAQSVYGSFRFMNGSNNGGAGYEPAGGWEFGINLCSASDLACGMGYGSGWCDSSRQGQVWIK